ncbi:hydrolase [Pedobacter chinensis]|uniref:Hydrolase n=1 Tax=Pedobacter chinensis TaxID=2282421 RepID=A0A369PZF6_9SPHI|nr:hydrolase [Pedobacter chinensis]RDC56367.1 hydrolase [Pedobacter chinensis]
MKISFLTTVLLIASFSGFSQKPGSTLLNPTNHALVLIDYEGQMAFATGSIPIDQLRNNTALVAGASKIFNVPTIVTTVAEKSFSGPVFPEIQSLFPSSTYIDRTSMNTWEDINAHKAITGKGKKKLVLGGLWTSVCIVGPALSALGEGYEVYVITDACGDVSKEAHEMAVTRMVQAGARPLTSLQYLLELQRDWAREETYQAVTDLAVKHAGGYGIGIHYSREMVKH